MSLRANSSNQPKESWNLLAFLHKIRLSHGSLINYPKPSAGKKDKIVGCGFTYSSDK